MQRQRPSAGFGATLVTPPGRAADGKIGLVIVTVRSQVLAVEGLPPIRPVAVDLSMGLGAATF
jgi:hypothetical protein